VFPTRKGGEWQRYRHYLQRGWHKLMDEAGFTDEIEEDGAITLVRKYTPYALRLFFASVLIEQNKSAKFIQSVMGHEDIKMTFDTYGHLPRRKELERTEDQGGILHYVDTASCGELVAEHH
jgi:integrase